MKKYSRGMASFVVMMMLSPVAAQAADGKVTFNGSHRKYLYGSE